MIQIRGNFIRCETGEWISLKMINMFYCGEDFNKKFVIDARLSEEHAGFKFKSIKSGFLIKAEAQQVLDMLMNKLQEENGRNRQAT